MYDLCLSKPIDGLGAGNVASVANAADQGFVPGLCQALRVFDRDILLELVVLALHGLQPLGNIRGSAGALAAVDNGLLPPVKERVRGATDLGGNRLAGPQREG